jgi:predicted glycosyltransferase
MGDIGLLKKVLIYAHDGVGYGHISRMANFANELNKRNNYDILIISGYGRLLDFIGNSFNNVKLPSYDSEKFSENKKRDILLLRQNIIKVIVDSERFDYFIVDFFPLGKKGELEEILNLMKIKYTKTTTILTLRGVLFCKNKTQEFFGRNDNFEYINKLYDHIISFSDKNIIDMNEEYFNSITIPIHYCGYLFCKFADNRNSNPKEIIVNFGGGYQCDLILKELISIIVNDNKFLIFNFYILIGEYFKESTIDEISDLASNCDNMKVLPKIPKINLVNMKCDLVIGCGGYNTTIDAIFNNLPLIIIPKQNTMECLIHSERLMKFSSISILNINELDQLYNKIDSILKSEVTHNLLEFDYSIIQEII